MGMGMVTGMGMGMGMGTVIDSEALILVLFYELLCHNS